MPHAFAMTSRASPPRRVRLAADQGKDRGVDKCTVLQPALSLMYLGLVDEGRLLVRELYRGADVDAFEKETLEKVRSSTLWVAR